MQSLRHRLSVAMLCDRDHFLLPSHTLNRYRWIFRGRHCKIWLNYSFWWLKFGSKVASTSSTPCKGEKNCLSILCLQEFRFLNLRHITWQPWHSFQIPCCSVLDQIIFQFNRSQKIEDLTKSKNFFTDILQYGGPYMQCTNIFFQCTNVFLSAQIYF